jgi:hypothetical protein
VSQPAASRRICSPPPAEPETAAEVRTLLAGLYAPVSGHDRRREQRYPYPRLVRLTPVADDGQTIAGNSITAAGKHLSESGFSFFHPTPLAYRWMVVFFTGGCRPILLDVDWCRFTRQGWYESGGRFLRLARLPLRGTAAGAVISPFATDACDVLQPCG